MHIVALLAVFAVVLAVSASPAEADFRLCNNTGIRVGVAIGYKDNEGWTTEGWWNVSSRSCETLLRGALVARNRELFGARLRSHWLFRSRHQ